jgi:hypothetical protein
MHNSQRCDTVLQIDRQVSNLYIPVNTKECFRLIDFGATLSYLQRLKLGGGHAYDRSSD